MNLNVPKMLKDFLSDSKRVLDISYKPDMETFKRTLKIVLVGTIILGAIGFLISEIIKFLTTGGF